MNLSPKVIEILKKDESPPTATTASEWCEGMSEEEAEDIATCPHPRAAARCSWNYALAAAAIELAEAINADVGGDWLTKLDAYRAIRDIANETDPKKD